MARVGRSGILHAVRSSVALSAAESVPTIAKSCVHAVFTAAAYCDGSPLTMNGSITILRPPIPAFLEFTVAAHAFMPAIVSCESAITASRISVGVMPGSLAGGAVVGGDVGGEVGGL